MRQALNAESTGISAEKISAYLWMMFAICFLGNILGGTTSTLMSVYLPEVVKELIGTLDKEQLSHISAYISALFFIGWAIGGLSWGLIGDRIGRARSLAMAVSMFGLFTLLTGFASTWKLVTIFRFFTGFGIGGMLVINTTLLSEAWPEKTRAIFMGILSVGFPVGIFSSGAVNYLVSNWRQGFSMGIFPLIIGIASFLVLKESEKWKASQNLSSANIVSEKNHKHRIDLVNGSIIFGCMLIGLWAIFSWLPTWVQSILQGGDGQHERGISMMLLGAGGLSGGFLSGWISNALGTRKSMLVCFSGCFILSFLLFKTNTVFSGITLIEIALLSFMFGISQGLLSVYIPMLFPVSVRAASTGFCFNIGRFLTAAAVFFVGALVVTLGGYGNSLFTFSFVFLLGFIMLLFSKKLTK
jgi:predicted MFS family arabinose efflux permease